MIDDVRNLGYCLSHNLLFAFEHNLETYFTALSCLCSHDHGTSGDAVYIFGIDRSNVWARSRGAYGRIKQHGETAVYESGTKVDYG